VEIVLVMNNADARELVCPLDDPRLRVLAIEKNLGQAAAANAGAAAARGDRFVFTDHDVVFCDGWLDAVQRLHERTDAAGATGVRVANPHTLRVLDFGIGFSRMNAPHPHMDQRLDSPLVSTERSVQAMCSSGLTMDRAVFEQLGGFDEELGNFYADIDLCLRLKDLGRGCRVAPDALAYHFGGDFSHIGRSYKAGFLKSDVKAWFRAKNYARIAVDMERYYDESWRHLLACGASLETEYVGCSLMNVADPAWYVGVLSQYTRVIDVAYLPSGNRDASAESLYDALGYDYLKLRFPIAYFVDRFVSVGGNGLWWQQRAGRSDIAVDRNGNVMPVAQLLATDTASSSSRR
jgi:glycosyltransferase involved in cell wall biosynthesis